MAPCESVEDLIGIADFNHNGTISFTEWLVCTKKRSFFTDDELDKAFNYLDFDKNGSISSSDLSGAFERPNINERVFE